jgi:SAM-dependent methyltransferase
MSQPVDYVHGHHESVLRSHTWRTVANSAAYLRPHLAPGQRVLDVGCGPGTITAEMARIVAPGRVTGVDASTDVIRLATAEHGEVADFGVGDVYALDFDDDTFDVVHAHQVLQHLAEPVRALAEMRRVTKTGGLVAARDSDYGGMTWAPDTPALDRWMTIYQRMTAANGQDANAGRRLLGWARQAGFTDVAATSSTWTFADPESRAWWAGLWADRVLHSSYGIVAVERGLANQADLAAIAAGWRRWAEQPDGFFVCPHGEILATA